MYSCADVVGDLGAEGSVVHEEDIQIFYVSYCEFLQSIGQKVSCFFIRSVSYFRHLFVSSESSSHSVVDTFDKRVMIPCALLQLGANLPA